jgi:hypothetical protein
MKRKSSASPLECDELWFDDVRDRALERSIDLVARRHGTHWQFRLLDTGAYVMDYWPASGEWGSTVTGEKGTEEDPFHALEVAAKLAVIAGRPGGAA